MQGILIIFFVVVGVPLNLICRSGGEIMGSEVHCSLKYICETTNSAVLSCMVKSYEQLCNLELCS